MVTRFGYIAPHEHTQGAVGDMYIDKSTGDVYECIDVVTNPTNYGYLSIDGNVSGTTYVWTKKSGGASSWNDLTDKPFYEETTVVNEPLNITWDGNTEGLVVTHHYDDGHFISGFYKVSDVVLTDEQIRKATSYSEAFDGEVIEGDFSWCLDESSDCLACENYVFTQKIIFVRKPTILYPECGIYFHKGMSVDDGFESHVISFTIAEPIEYRKISEKKLDMKYLPSDVHDIFNVNITYVDPDVGYVSDKTYAEVYDVMRAGKPIFGTLTTEYGTVTVMSSGIGYSNCCCLSALDVCGENSSDWRIYRISIRPDGVIDVHTVTLNITPEK